MEVLLRKAQTEKGIRNGYVLAFVLLFVSYIATFYANKQRSEQEERVELTNQVIYNLNQITAKVSESGLATRGYLLTKNIQFLYPYIGAKQEVDSLLLTLDRLLKHRQTQWNRLQIFKHYVQERFLTFNIILAEFNANNMVLGDSFKKMEQSIFKTMENVRVNGQPLEKEEMRLLAEYEDRVLRISKSITTITVISLTLAIALVLFGVITFNVVSKSRQAMLDELMANEQELHWRIDDLDRANAELVRMKGMEKFAATGRMARNIAHEVRNPLTNIGLATSQLKSDWNQVDDEAMMLFSIIERNAKRIDQLISDLLISTKFSELKFENISLTELLNATLTQAADRISLLGIKLIKNFASEKIILSVDSDRMKIALLNIIINAVESLDATKENFIKITTQKLDTYCTIAIEDSGIGMDEETLSNIFEPYYTAKLAGNGLGLTNTQTIILNHNGGIQVTSKLGQGTIFEITLPMVADEK